MPGDHLCFVQNACGQRVRPVQADLVHLVQILVHVGLEVLLLFLVGQTNVVQQAGVQDVFDVGSCPCFQKEVIQDGLVVPSIWICQLCNMSSYAVQT